MRITGIEPLSNISNIAQSNSNANSSVGGNFSDLLASKLDDLSSAENNYSVMKSDYANGKRDDVQNILIEGEKVSLDLSFALQVRNKLVDMFQEISRMQI